jgi:ribosomal 30S subunit maturation factor RimM
MNKIIEEFIDNGIKANELLRRGNYYVSDIASYEVYTKNLKKKIGHRIGI